MQPTCGIQNINIIAAKRGLRFGALGDGHWIFALDDGQGVDPDLDAKNLQLFHRGGAIDIERGHQHPFPVFFTQALGQFRGGGGFA